MKYTPENVIENLPNIGPWSSYYLAEIALKHYFPDEIFDGPNWDSSRMVQLADEMGCPYWQDVIIKYQNEVGYNETDFAPDYVNRH